MYDLVARKRPWCPSPVFLIVASVAGLIGSTWLARLVCCDCIDCLLSDQAERWPVFQRHWKQ